MKKRTHKMEQKLKKLRKKYAEGLVSDYYMRTGIPEQFKNQAEEADKHIAKMKGEFEKAEKKRQKEAEKAYKKNQRKRKSKIEERIIFM